MNPSDYLQAARVPHSLVPQFFGKWIIHRAPYDAPAFGWKDCTFLAHKIRVPVDMSNIHLSDGESMFMDTWDTVMEDSAGELKKHLPIWLKAKGRVLITGLGLGCVVRGLLASTAVEHIDVIELDPDIYDIVGEEFRHNPRVTLHLGDALTYQLPKDSRWDFAWHDIWTPKNEGLQVQHAKLMVKYRRVIGTAQGAWAFPRCFKRRFSEHMSLL